MEIENHGSDSEKYNCTFFIDNIEATLLNDFAEKLPVLINGEIGAKIEIVDSQNRNNLQCDLDIL